MENNVSSAVVAVGRFDSLPDQVRDFLLSAEVKNNRIELVKKYSLEMDKHSALAKVRRNVYDKDINLTDFPLKVAEALGEPLETVKPLVIDILGYEMLPLSDFLGDVSGVIKSLGGDPFAYPSIRITIRIITPSDVVTEVLHEHPVNIPAFLEHRMREILESRVRNVRKDFETVQRLTRAEKIGGVEMDRAVAEELVGRVSAKAAAVKIAPEPVIESVIKSPPEAVMTSGSTPILVKQVASASPAVVNVSRKGDGVMHFDEHEAQAIREKVLPNIISSDYFDLGKEIGTAIDSVIAVHGNGLSDDLTLRFRTIIESRLKGIRDVAEITDLLTRGLESGGMGFNTAVVANIVLDIEKRAQDIHGKRDEVQKKEKEVFVKNSVNNTFVKDESRKSATQEDLDRMYGALTGKRQSVQQIKQPVAKIPTEVVAVPAVSTNFNVETEVVPAPQISSAEITAPAPETVIAPPVPTPPPAPSSPYMYTPRMTLTPTAVIPSPKMQDVRPLASSARLTGPVEELRNITLEDFRRLSTDPAEACRKLLDKLDLLEAHSFGQRIEGAKAWRESEINKMYLEVLTASFSGGKSIASSVAEAISQNRTTLTEREVHAIMDMNRKLKA